MKNTSVRTNYRPVKAFCKWLFQEDYINKDITIGIKLPKNDASVVEPRTNKELLHFSAYARLWIKTARSY